MEFLNLFERSPQERGVRFAPGPEEATVVASLSGLGPVALFDNGGLTKVRAPTEKYKMRLHRADPHRFLIFSRLCGMRCTLTVSYPARSIVCAALLLPEVFRVHGMTSARGRSSFRVRHEAVPTLDRQHFKQT